MPVIFASKKQLKEIIMVLNRLSQGELGQRAYIKSEDLIGELGQAVNLLAEKLENRIAVLEKENSKVRAILDNMVEGVVAVDKDTRIISVNPTFAKIFNISEKVCQGKLFLEIIRNSDISEIIAEVLIKGEFISKEISLVWPVQRIFQINASALFEREAISGCVLVIHDITEMRKLETMRRDFVANVSHELKTPLTSIKGFVETLLEGALEDKENSRSFLEIIRDHTDRLNSLINDLLELSSIESRQVKPENQEVNLKELSQKILLGFGSQLKKKSIKVEIDLPDSLLIRVDPHQMEQVFTNLLDNAIKFNKDKGKVRIYAEEFIGEIRVTVEDSGIGIPEADVPRIFERFYRVDKARSRQLGGTGLGLAIVKHIVESRGGQVGVESTEGLGAKFWFTLPK